MTTASRLSLWLQTVASLKAHVDMDLIDRCAIIDDGSPPKDIQTMCEHWRMLFRNIPVSVLENQKGGEYRHQHSMELWRGLTWNEESVFHCEDDWVFEDNKVAPIKWAVELLKEYDWIGQCAFPHRDQKTPFTRFRVLTFANSRQYAPSKFTLQPSVININSIRMTGGFLIRPGFEIEYGNRWSHNMGYVTVYGNGWCHHIGEGNSSYDINKSIR